MSIRKQSRQTSRRDSTGSRGHGFIGVSRGTWDRVDPRWTRGHQRKLDLRPPLGKGGWGGHLRRRRLRTRCVAVRRRSMRRGSLLRPAHRPLRTQAFVHDHAGHLPARDLPHGAVLLAAVVLRLPLPHRVRHRRRVQRDQLGHRRAHPGTQARADRHRDQRKLLGRRDRRRDARGCRPLHHELRPQRRLAAVLRARRGARSCNPARSQKRPREPPLAVHSRPRRRGRAPRHAHRAGGARGDGPGAARARFRRSPCTSARRSRWL